jgi:hypothetical protein
MLPETLMQIYGKLLLALPQEQEVEVMGTLTQIFAYPQDLLRSVPDMGGTSIQVVEE